MNSITSVALALSFAAFAGPVAQPAGELKVTGCLVSPIDEAQVPAREAGVLVSLALREGSQAARGDLLGQIDDRPLRASRRVADYQLQVVEEQAKSDVDVRYAVAAAEVAEAEYDVAREVNAKVEKTISATEVRRLQLAHKRAVLQIEQADLEHRVAGLTSQMRAAERDTVDGRLERHRIESPLNGVIVKVHRHVGEWLSAGEPIVHILRMDRLRVEGYVSLKDHVPQRLRGRPVTVTVRLPQQQTAQFTGRIVFVNPQIEANGEFSVWAEVENRQEAGDWLLCPGMTAEMAIRLSAD